MSNTERLVMIPLAPHTKREREIEMGTPRERGREWESEIENKGDMETNRRG